MTLSWLFCTHQGFQSAGKGATIPSRAMNRRSFSLIGSMPMDCAYSNISAKREVTIKCICLKSLFVTLSNTPKHAYNYEKYLHEGRISNNHFYTCKPFKQFCIMKEILCFSQVVYQESSYLQFCYHLPTI